MPSGNGWVYFIVLSDAYLAMEGDERHIRGFSELRDGMGCDESLSALRMARASGSLTEGRHALPDLVASFLAQSGADKSSVRIWTAGRFDPTIRAIPSSELACAWAGSDIEEIEVADQSALWYFRMKDDEPLIFVAVRSERLSDQLRRCADLCCEVGSDFEYAR
jgi:hypothetical protein